MSALKTQPTAISLADFLSTVDGEQKRADCTAIADIMQRITSCEPIIWGGTMVGFGSYSYTNTTKKEATWFLVGFAPRKQNITLYIMSGFDQYGDLVSKLGKCKTGGSCLYISKLSDIDVAVLESLIQASVANMRLRYPE